MPKILARILLLAAAVWVTGPTLPVQQTFKSRTSLLTVDVSVLDSEGNPVTGLTPDDFVVTLNKETQPVRTMVFLATQSHSTSETVRVPSPGSPPSPSPAAPDTSREPDSKLLVILLDDMSIYPTDSKGLFVAAERFVDTIPPRDSVGLASTSGRVTVNPSRDRTQLMTNLKQASGWMNDPRRDSKPFVGFMDALDADETGASLKNLIETACGLPIATKNSAQLLAESQCASEIEKKVRNSARFARTSTRNQLDTYAKVIKAMASAPGVKQLVILTGGIALRPADSLDFVPVAKAAAAAGVQISMLMEEPQEDITVGGAWVIDQRRMLQQAETLAEMSGGQLFHVVGQADRFYHRVLTSASAIYRIGVDLPQSVPPDGDYKVAVTVKRRGVKVLANRYATPPLPETVPTPGQRLQHAVTTGEPAGTGRDKRTNIAAVVAPEPHAAGLLAKVAAYLDSYEKAFAVVVSEEIYSQELHVDPRFSTRPTNVNPASLTERTRTLRSDVLQASVGERQWVAFRDVYEVDGKAVRDHDARLQRLFLEATPEAVEQTRHIVAESARFNLGELRRDFNVPTMALTYLARSNQPRSVFSITERKNLGGVPSIVLEFRERAAPTIIRSTDANVPATGRFWIDPESGRVLKSELAVADKRSTAKITVTYGPVAKLTVWAPVLMTEEYTGAETILAKATYSKFRQFNVSVGEAIK